MWLSRGAFIRLRPVRERGGPGGNAAARDGHLVTLSAYRPSGIRRVGSAKLDQAVVWNVRTWPAMPREKFWVGAVLLSHLSHRATA
jgi:hypothetical protein